MAVVMTEILSETKQSQDYSVCIPAVTLLNRWFAVTTDAFLAGKNLTGEMGRDSIAHSTLPALLSSNPILRQNC